MDDDENNNESIQVSSNFPGSYKLNNVFFSEEGKLTPVIVKIYAL
jgi:hypothetical protein